METSTQKVSSPNAGERLSPEQVRNANRLLEFLVSQANPDWQKVLTQGLTPTEMTQAEANVDAALNALDIEAPVGAVVGGTGTAKDGAALPGEDGQIAVQVLKDQHRLVQCGRGRGKFLMVITEAPITDEMTLNVRDAKVRPKAQQEELTPGARVEADIDELRTLVRTFQQVAEDFERRINTISQDVENLRRVMIPEDPQPAITW